MSELKCSASGAQLSTVCSSRAHRTVVYGTTDAWTAACDKQQRVLLFVVAPAGRAPDDVGTYRWRSSRRLEWT
jgi:hypothetical protein